MGGEELLKKYQAVRPPAPHIVENLLDPSIDEERARFFEDVKHSLGLGNLAAQTYFTERSHQLRNRRDPEAPVEYLDELWVKDSEIIATVFREEERDGTKRVVFSKQPQLSGESLDALAQTQAAERLIDGVDSEWKL